MREYEFVADENAIINFSPKDKYDEIIQNVITICSTQKGTRPMDRDFGINFVMVDQPMQKEHARLTSEIVQAVKKYEPRAEIVSIEMGWSELHALLWPKVLVRVKD